MAQTTEKVMKGINIKTENAKYVEQLAEEENRNFSNMLDTIIERYRQARRKITGQV